MNMARVVNSRVALITGGGQGIGQVIAKRRHANGFKVAVADGIAPPSAIEEVTAEYIEKLYSIWHHAPNLAL